MSQHEKFDYERRGAKTFFAECAVITQWFRDGRLLFSDEADARVAAARREGMERALNAAIDLAKTCPNDLGIDMEQGPLGCRLCTEGGCVCHFMATAIRAEMEADDG